MRSIGNSLTALLPVLACLVGPSESPAQSEDRCVECHSSSELRVTDKKLYEYYQKYKGSIHAVLGVGCADCHGGDPDAKDLDAIHAGVLERVRFDQIPRTCGSCHEEQLDSFQQSDHYRDLMDDGSAPNCVTCHGSMDMDFYFTPLVRTTCTFCHNQQSGIAPDVPDRAEYILSKINVIKGYRTFVRKFQPGEDVLSEIDAEALARNIGLPIDTARATYTTDSITVDSAPEFQDGVSAFYLHLLRHTRLLISQPSLPSYPAEISGAGCTSTF